MKNHNHKYFNNDNNVVLTFAHALEYWFLDKVIYIDLYMKLDSIHLLVQDLKDIGYENAQWDINTDTIYELK